MYHNHALIWLATEQQQTSRRVCAAQLDNVQMEQTLRQGRTKPYSELLLLLRRFISAALPFLSLAGGPDIAKIHGVIAPLVTGSLPLTDAAVGT